MVKLELGRSVNEGRQSASGLAACSKAKRDRDARRFDCCFLVSAVSTFSPTVSYAPQYTRPVSFPSVPCKYVPDHGLGSLPVIMPFSPFVRPQCLLQALRTCRAVAPRFFSRCITTSGALPAQISEVETGLLKIPLPASATHHNSLETFLAYSARTGINRSTPVWVGTHYEYTAAKYLQRLGFSLVRTGGACDSGIDLIGYWTLPELPAPIPVILQCKLRATPRLIGPHHVRELRGAFYNVPLGWETSDVPVMALLVVSGPPSKGTIDALAALRRPMGFINMTTEGIIKQFLWNKAARLQLLEGVGVTLRHSPRDLLSEEELLMELGPQGLSDDLEGGAEKKELEDTDVTGIRKDIQLTWMGLPMFPDEREVQQAASQLLGELGESQGLQSVLTPVPDGSIAITGDPTVATATTIAPVVESTAPTTPSSIATASPSIPVKRGRGRPRGSKNKPAAESPSTPMKKGRGRPRGSKNKPRAESAPVAVEVVNRTISPVLTAADTSRRRPRSLNFTTLHSRAVQGPVDAPQNNLLNIAAARGETAYSLTLKLLHSKYRNLGLT